MGTRIALATLGIATLALAGCSALSPGAQSKATPSPSATQSEMLRWLQSDAFKECHDLYASVPGSTSDSPRATCQAMASEYDVDELIAAFSDPAQVDQMWVDLQVQVGVESQTTPTPSPSLPAQSSAPHVISDQARHVLDTNLGAGFAAAPELKDQYCTLSDAALQSTAEVLVGMYRDITTADVVAYVNELCGR